MGDVTQAANLNWVYILLGVLIILVALRFIIELVDYFKKRGGITTTADRRNATVDSTAEKVDELVKVVNKISDKQNSIEERLSKIEEDNKSYRQNDTRNELIKMYRYYYNDHSNPMKAWTQIEHDGFINLYSEYDKNNGNGFVHNTIYPDMMSLTVIQMTQAADLAKLYASRGASGIN